jgi:hypothetical protein
MTHPQTQPTKKPWYMKWWVWLIGAFLLIGVIGAIVNPNQGDEVTDTAPGAMKDVEQTDATTAPEPAEAEIDSASGPGQQATDQPSGDEVAAFVAAKLEQATLQDACVADEIYWACNVEDIVVVSPTEMHVTVSQVVQVDPLGIAIGFENFTSTAPDELLPELTTVVVFDSAGTELARVE